METWGFRKVLLLGILGCFSTICNCTGLSGVLRRFSPSCASLDGFNYVCFPVSGRIPSERLIVDQFEGMLPHLLFCASLSAYSPRYPLPSHPNSKPSLPSKFTALRHLSSWLRGFVVSSFPVLFIYSNWLEIAQSVILPIHSYLHPPFISSFNFNPRPRPYNF